MRHIDSTGRIINNGNSQLLPLNLARSTVALFIIIILYISNPGNETSNELKNGKISKIRNRYRKYVGSYSFDLFGFDIDLFRSNYRYVDPKFALTNFEIFSLDKGYSSEGISIWILNTRFLICKYDGPAGEICEWISENLCHGQTMFDSKNRPFTAHRIICYLMIFSRIISICSRFGKYRPVASVHNLYYNPISIILSVISQPKLEDFMFITILYYPFLTVIDKVISNNFDEWHFFGIVFLIFFGIGGLVNLVSSKVTNKEIYGVYGVISCALSYVNYLSPKMKIIQVLGFNLTASDVLISYFILGLLDNSFNFLRKIFRFQTGYHSRCTVSWVLGAVAGSILGKYHYENYNIWWWF